MVQARILTYIWLALHSLIKPHTLDPKLPMGCMLQYKPCNITNCLLSHALAGSPSIALAKQPGPQQATVAATQACTAGKQTKPVSGLKRGFLSGTKSKRATVKQANNSANPAHDTGSADGSRAGQGIKSAISIHHVVFTGSIVEHQDPQATDHGGHNASGLFGNDSRGSMSRPADTAASSVAACTAPKRVSKLKQTRSAVSINR
jgi:hypothetical protein